MKFALVGGERQEAQSGLLGQCQCCGVQTIAKCGAVRIKHWAHRGKCDSWKEGETEWHRTWKGRFPEAWQEVLHYADDREKHIADVKTDQGYVIEFQHSPIESKERQAREAFYKKMVWVVDGTRRVRDKKGFVDVLKYARRVGNEAVRKLQGYADEWALLRDWGDSQVPVFFDFGEDILWGLLPKAMDGRYVFRVARNELVDVFRHTSQMTFEGVLNALAKLLAQWRTSEEIRAALSQGSWSPSPADFLRRRGHRRL